MTAADAAFILRAVVGLETLPSYTPTARIANADAHFTFNGFYGDWTQGPVLDRVWANSQDYLMYFAAENVYFSREDGIVYSNGEVYRTKIDCVTGDYVEKKLIRTNHARVCYDTSGLEIRETDKSE